MKIALLSGANPRVCKEGPTVRLLKGSWAIGVQGIIDSELTLHVDGYECTNVWHPGMTLHIDEAELVKLHFSKRGSESFIVAFAEKV